MKRLEIQVLLRLHGLQHVKEYLKLDVKEKDNLVLLNYRQLDADWSKSALLDCRGIILDRSKDWKVVAFPYEKFFNIGEGYCAQIDWDNAKFYEKSDGCCDADTLLITEDGEKTIREICETKYNGKVLGYDLDLNINVFTDVLGHEVKSNNNDWYELELENGQTIRLTGNHKVWLPLFKCYRAVRDLTENDIFLVK